MKHFFFDMDGTICESRQIISAQMKKQLAKLRAKGNSIIVISGAERERIKKQLDGLKVDYIMAQSGSDSPFWKRKITTYQEIEVEQHLREIKKQYPFYNWSSFDLVDRRGCQISFSFVGHHEDLEIKNKFDPDGSTRINILKKVPFYSLSLECKVAGSTCYDYTHKEYTKGKNIERLIKRVKWDKKDCVYFGDKLFKGGNDETVIGVIETVEVKSPEDLSAKLKAHE